MNITVENGPYFDVWGEALPCLFSMWWIFFIRQQAKLYCRLIGC